MRNERNNLNNKITNTLIKFIYIRCIRDILSIDKSGYKAYLNKLDDNFAPDLKVKLKLFAHFTTSMERNLMDSSNYKSSSINSKRHRPTLHTWFTTTRAIIMHLTNGTVQVRVQIYYCEEKKEEEKCAFISF